ERATQRRFCVKSPLSWRPSASMNELREKGEYGVHKADLSAASPPADQGTRVPQADVDPVWPSGVGPAAPQGPVQVDRGRRRQVHAEQVATMSLLRPGVSSRPLLTRSATMARGIHHG